MTRSLGAVCVAIAMAMAMAAVPSAARADEVSDLIDKGIESMGGKDKIAKPAAFSTQTKGALTINGQEGEVSAKTIAAGLDKYRAEAEAEFNGQAFKITTIIDGDKGWRKVNDNVMDVDGDGLANEKRTLRLAQAAMLTPLKGGKFKVEKAGEEKVDDKPALVLKVTDPEGKESKLYLDKQTGLPLKQTATVAGFMGDEVDQETLFKDYKDFNGYKRPAKTEVKRNGERFVVNDLVEFKPLDKIPDGSFDRPE